MDETLNIIVSAISTEGEKVVVFSQWERMTRLIAQELEKRGIGFEYLHGGVPSQQRGALLNNFADNPDSKVFLSTDAGSTGLNLQSASTVINLDLPWNPAVLEQRIARIYRLGQQRNVQVINLVSAGTIEEQMLDKLRFKSAMFEGVLDNGEDTIFLGEGTKLAQMMDTIGEMMEDRPTPNTDSGHYDMATGAEEMEGSVDKSDTPDSSQSPESLDTPDKQTSLHFPPAEEDNVITDTEAPREETQEETTSSEHVPNGQEHEPSGLVNTIVHTDQETGETTLRIPVADKQTVKNLLDIVGKLFG